MKRRICLISESLSPPFDEGIKNFALQLARCLEVQSDFLGISGHACPLPGLQLLRIPLPRLLVSRALTRALRDFTPQLIVYLPAASLTLNSFIRAWLLKRVLPGTRLAIIGLQPKRHSSWARALIRHLGCGQLFVQGRESLAYYAGLGLKAALLPSGVDLQKFHPVDINTKLALRARYGYAPDVRLLCHVGHLHASRNLALLEAACRLPGVQVLMVASSYAQPDTVLRERLLKAGVAVHCGFVKRLEEMYQLADAYLFPVTDVCGAIGMPLSVLEALACGLPVITTAFGALRDAWPASPALIFIREASDLARALAALDSGLEKGVARSLAAGYSWEAVCARLLEVLCAPNSFA